MAREGLGLQYHLRQVPQGPRARTSHFNPKQGGDAVPDVISANIHRAFAAGKALSLLLEILG